MKISRCRSCCCHCQGRSAIGGCVSRWRPWGLAIAPPITRDNCPAVYNPDQADGDHNGKGDLCDPEYQENLRLHPPPPPPPVPPQFTMKYIGTFGPANNPIATFVRDNEIVNVRVGETFDGKFILRGIGIESAEIGYVGFPPETTTRVPIGQ